MASLCSISIKSSLKTSIPHKANDSVLLDAHFLEKKREWQEWRSEQSFKGFWEERENQKKFLDWMFHRMDFRSMSDWYKIRRSDIVKWGGSGMLWMYEQSPSSALMNVYQEYVWHPWLFQRAPLRLWENSSVRRTFWDWCAEVLCLKNLDDWYGVRRNEVVKLGGAGLLLMYEELVGVSLVETYGDTAWNVWMFDSHQHKAFAKHVVFHSQYFEWFADQLSLGRQEDWYSISKEMIRSRHGSFVLEVYQNSLEMALETAMADIPWQPWRFEDWSREYWEKLANQRKFTDWIAEQLNVNRMQDWYRIQNENVVKYGGDRVLVANENSIATTLQRVYHQSTWYPWLFQELPAVFWDNIGNQHKYFDWLEEQLNIVQLSHWYKISLSDMQRVHNSSVVQQYYNNSLSEALKCIYAHVEWHEWMFVNFPRKFWKGANNQYRFIEWLANHLHVEKIEDWYPIPQEKIMMAGGLPLLSFYGGYLKDVLASLYPDLDWQLWIFDAQPHNFWTNTTNHRYYFDWLAKKLGLAHMEHWYSVTRQDIIKNGGSVVLKFYGDTVGNALQKVYPEWKWQLWRLDNLPQGYWGDIKHHRQFLDWLAAKLNVKSPSDWYLVKRSQVIENGGEGLLKAHNNSLARALEMSYPDVDWQPWKIDEYTMYFWADMQNQRKYLEWFESQSRKHVHVQEDISSAQGFQILKLHSSSRCPDTDWLVWKFDTRMPWSFWENIKNQRQYLDWFAEQIGLSRIEEWYSLQVEDFDSFGGSGLIKDFYHESVFALLKTVYPETQWMAWKFRHQLPTGFWNDQGNVKHFVNWLESEFGVENITDWLQFTAVQVVAYHGGSLLKFTGGLVNLLTQVYPQISWNSQHIGHLNSAKAQAFLCKSVKAIFPETEVEFDYFSSMLAYSNTQREMELDVWIPQWNMGLEYQGKQHYFPNHFYSVEVPQFQKDAEKALACKEVQATLIPIPYWWDFKESSIAETIRKMFPEAVKSSHSGLPIPSVRLPSLSEECRKTLDSLQNSC